MKRLRLIFLLSAAAAIVSCSKAGSGDFTESAVSFNVQDKDLKDVQTKAASVVTEPSLRVSGFNVSAVRGAEGADEKVTWFDNTHFTFRPDESLFSGGRRWPSFDPLFRFYASNADLAYGAGGATVEARNTQDVVCAYNNSPTYEAVNLLEFEHIFTMVGGVSVKWEPGYVLSDILITTTPVTGGTYNLYTGYGNIDGTAGWDNLITATDPFPLFLFPDTGADPPEGNPYNPEVSTPVKTNQLDMLMVPGDYEISATWSASLRTGSLQREGTYTRKKTIHLQAGNRYVISAVLGGDLSMFILEIEHQPIVEWDASVRFGEWVHYNELWK